MHFDNCPVRPHCPSSQARLDLPTTWETEISDPSYLLSLEGQCLREWNQRKMNRHLMNLASSMGSTLSLGDTLLSYLPSHRVPFHASQNIPRTALRCRESDMTRGHWRQHVDRQDSCLSPRHQRTGLLMSHPAFKCWLGGRTMRNTDTMVHALQCEESSQSACRRICITGNAAQAPAECEQQICSQD